MDEKNLSDEELIHRYLGGEKEIFQEIYARYHQKVFALAFRMTGNQDDALEVTQEVFLKIFRSIHKFRKRSKFSTWVFSIANNTCLDFLRNRKKAALPLKNEVSLTPNPNSKWEIKEMVQKALLELPTDLRSPIILCDLFGFKYEKISEILSLPLGTVKSKIARGRKMLAQKLENLREEGKV